MSKVDFELDRKGVAELMKSANMQSVIKKHASKIRGRAGAGYAQDLYVGKNRVNSHVWAESKEAKSDNLKHNTLLKSVR